MGPLSGVSFTLDGVEFTCNGRWSSFVNSDLASRALRADPAALLALTAESFLLVLGRAEYERFTRHVIEHETPEPVIADIAAWLNDQAAGRVAALAGR
jgi:hypothetical protein